MHKQKTNSLHRWELALLTALCITLLTGLWADRTQQSLSDGLIRLHVIANSDSPEDQAEKYQLRDDVLALLSPLLKNCGDQSEAVDIIKSHQAELEALGDVSVTLGPEYYPLRRYSTFSLPAGEYMSLRVTIGEGKGRNWWCVVFPPLCTEALAEDAEDAFLSLDEQSSELIDGQGPVYDLRFRVVDLWGQLKEKLSR
ncbi:MAG: stage II sporulation protein R [Oscillospiraceae bacterium]